MDLPILWVVCFPPFPLLAFGTTALLPTRLSIDAFFNQQSKEKKNFIKLIFMLTGNIKDKVFYV